MRGPLPAAGQSVIGDVPDQPTRLLATAYDSKWRLKKVIPKDAIPKDQLLGRSQSSSCVRSPQKCKTHMGFSRPGLRQAAEAKRPGSVPERAKTEPLSPKSPKSPTSPKTRQKHKDKGLDLNFSLELERPGSAGSEKEREQKRIEMMKLKEEQDLGREEKPLQEWALEAGVPVDIAKQALDTFLDFVTNPPPAKYRLKKDAILFGAPFDASTDLGSMETEDFGKACCRIADCKDLTALPDGFLEQAMHAADKDGSGDIDFEEFLYFYYKFSFSEEVLIGPAERQIRCAARDHGIPYDEIGKYKYVFDQTDTNHNGRICLAEFKVLIIKLLKVPKGEELPEKRVKDMWKEATKNSNGHDLDFLTFVGWYKRYFMGAESDSGESPFEAFYHNIRRVSAYDSSQFH